VSRPLGAQLEKNAMNAPANVPAPQRQLAPIEVLKNTVARKSDDFKMVLPSHISVDKFQRTIATAALSNPKLLECDRQSLLIASMKLAQDGLLPDGREAALVPFSTRVKQADGQWVSVWQVQAMPMAYGLRKKVLQSGEVISLQVGVVYAAEVASGNFLYEIGIEPPIRHRPKLDMTEAEMADDQMVAAYSIARIKSDVGEPYWSVEVMRRAEVLKVRQMSQTGALGKTDRQGKPIAPKGPWVDWEPEMWKKTVLRRHTKVLPMSGDILDFLERDNAEEARAAGAARLLETETLPPKALPSADDLASDEGHDPETGEVFEQDAAGRTVEDEETARALDANDGTLSADNPTAAEGPADEDRGEAHVEHDDKPAWFDHVAKIRAGLAAAKTKTYVAEINAEYEKSRAALPDDVVAELDGLVTAARKRVQNAEV